MTESTKTNIIIVVTILIIGAMLVWFGYTVGHSNGRSEGWDASSELQKKLDCQYEWGGKPNTEVPVRCLKYLE